jgi:hypothetical protein
MLSGELATMRSHVMIGSLTVMTSILDYPKHRTDLATVTRNLSRVPSSGDCGRHSEASKYTFGPGLGYLVKATHGYIDPDATSRRLRYLLHVSSAIRAQCIHSLIRTIIALMLNLVIELTKG